MKSTTYQLAKAHQNIFKSDGIIQQSKKNGNFFRVRSSEDRRRKYNTTHSTCNCIGFSYRGHCSHITALRVLSRTSKGGLVN